MPAPFADREHSACPQIRPSPRQTCVCVDAQCNQFKPCRNSRPETGQIAPSFQRNPSGRIRSHQKPFSGRRTIVLLLISHVTPLSHLSWPRCVNLGEFRDCAVLFKRSGFAADFTYKRMQISWTPFAAHCPVRCASNDPVLAEMGEIK